MLPAKTVIMQTEYWLSLAEQTTSSRCVREIVGKLRQKVNALQTYRYEGQKWEQDRADELKDQILDEARQMLDILEEYDAQASEFCRKYRYLCDQAEKLRRRGVCEGCYYLCYIADWVHDQAEQLYISEDLCSEIQKVIDSCSQMEVRGGVQ